eukprot:1159244-Pelagomonas_calceolata.AAC.1
MPPHIAAWHTLGQSIPKPTKHCPFSLRILYMSPYLGPPGCLGPSCLPRFLDLPACPSGCPSGSPAAVSCCCTPSALAGAASVLAWTARGCAGADADAPAAYPGGDWGGGGAGWEGAGWASAQSTLRLLDELVNITYRTSTTSSKIN